ncbi:cell cycle arrest protein BUB3 [Enteropsectra breve]|nr:cell cycle arrest protein BUB3 [Enteropsectra breve]
MAKNIPLNRNLSAGATDIAFFENRLIVAAWDSKIRVYKDKILTHTIDFEHTIHRLNAISDQLICVSCDGWIYILDREFSQITAIETKTRAYYTLADENMLLVGGMDKTLSLYEKKTEENKENAYNTVNYELKWIKECHHNITAVAMGESTFLSDKKAKLENNSAKTSIIKEKVIAIAFENIITIFDREFNEIFCKKTTGVINSITVSASGIFAGTSNGKIYYTDFSDKDKSYVFNAHYVSEKDCREYYPINQVFYDKFLFSAGGNGTVCKWDVEERKLVGVVMKAEQSIKRFLLEGYEVYAIVEELDGQSEHNQVVYSTI